MELLLEILPYVDSVSAMAVLGVAFVWMRYIDKEKQFNRVILERLKAVEAEVRDCERDRDTIEAAFNALKLEHAVLTEKYDKLFLEFEKVKAELRFNQQVRNAH